jgi:predicted ferric reductase
MPSTSKEKYQRNLKEFQNKLLDFTKKKSEKGMTWSKRASLRSSGNRLNSNMNKQKRSYYNRINPIQRDIEKQRIERSYILGSIRILDELQRKLEKQRDKLRRMQILNESRSTFKWR